MQSNGKDAGFVAVTTTGIYCRPGCSGRPLEEHVRRYPYAAAAEAAGYRACLRCRPYRASEPVDWIGAPELVCRAVRMIVDGAMDGQSEDRLAARLGVSGRHLRRLFAEHVGATPDQVARSRRAHFARRLLDDTDLPIIEVAYASGFGSVRQLNRVMHDIFRASPTALRTKRRRTDRLVADGGLTLRLPYRPPLAWDALLRFLRPRAIPGVEVVDGSIYRRTIVVEGDPGVIEVAAGDDDHLLLRAHLPHWEGLIHLVQPVRRLFDLDADVSAVAAVLRGDPQLGPLVSATGDLRIPGTWDPFECGVRAIIGQQVSVAGATTLTGRLVERFGTPVPGLGPMGLAGLFPTPDVLATASLESVGLTKARASAVRAFAGAIADGSARLDRGQPLEEICESLTSLPGVGDWTAHYVALRLGERDAFPASDLGLRRALSAGGAIPTVAELTRRAESWRPWRGYAAMVLWSRSARSLAA